MSPEVIEELVTAIARPGHVALIDDQGNRTEIPEVFFQHIERLIRLMSEQRAVMMIPEDETFTTQAAADYLGMSRQHFVNLLEEGKIGFHKVGSHRRVTFKNLLAFEAKRDKERRGVLDGLAETVDKAGRYESEYTGG